MSEINWPMTNIRKLRCFNADIELRICQDIFSNVENRFDAVNVYAVRRTAADEDVRATWAALH
jgi:hypothetical protein